MSIITDKEFLEIMNFSYTAVQELKQPIEPSCKMVKPDLFEKPLRVPKRKPLKTLLVS
jgi:hypothetical protein